MDNRIIIYPEIQIKRRWIYMTAARENRYTPEKLEKADQIAQFVKNVSGGSSENEKFIVIASNAFIAGMEAALQFQSKEDAKAN